MEVSFAACLDKTFASEVIQITNSSVAGVNAGRVDAVMTTKIKYFPRYFVVKLVRYYVDSDWKQKKIDAAVKMPELLDLTELLSTGLQPDETLIPETGLGVAASAGAGSEEDIAAARSAEDALTMQLVSMGFGENGCRRAARNTAGSGGDVEVAMNWVLEHMGDADFDTPIEPLGATPAAAAATSEPVYDEGTIAMLMSFGGFTESRVKRALKETDGNSERCIYLLCLLIDLVYNMYVLYG
jgi:ubiquitin carboxyl-terminal hydrolase 5/13